MSIADTDKCVKSPTGEHVWNYAPRPDNCRLGTCRYCEQQRVFEGALTHTAALIKTAPLKPETLEKAVVIAEKSLIRKVTEPAPAGRKSNRGGYKLSDKQKADIKRRIKAGDKVSVIADDFKVTDEVIYIFRRQMGIHGKNGKKSGPSAPPALAQVPPPEASIRNVDECVEICKAQKDSQLIEPKKKPTQVYNTNQGNIMSQMARLRRGEIRPRAARPVLTRYKEMLEGVLKAKQSEVKDLKQNISLTDEALRELDVIQQGEKAVVDKVLAAVR